MSIERVSVGVYDSHLMADAAIRKLGKSGFDMKKLSVVGKDYETEEHSIGFYNAGDRMKFWGKTGAFWGGLLGILFSPAMFIFPGFGHMIVFGPIVATLIGGLEGAVVVGGLSALGAALVSIGIPKDSVINYETQLKAGKYLVVLQGTEEELQQAHHILAEGSLDATLY